MRALQQVGGEHGEFFFVDPEGILTPIDVSALADGDVPVWNETLGVWVVQQISAPSLGGHWEPVANGDPDTPEIVFSDGDVVMTFVED